MNRPRKNVHIVKPLVCVAVWIGSLHGCGGHKTNLENYFFLKTIIANAVKMLELPRNFPRFTPIV